MRTIPIAEFLDLALAYERRHPPSLEGFLHWLETGETVVKRDLEQAPAAVRIMTVHGAKGLQAPIVFLPDTMQTPDCRRAVQRPVSLSGRCSPTVSPYRCGRRASGACDEIALGERERMKTEEMREYRRLLYVAMTRAEDRLIVCGWRGKKARAGRRAGITPIRRGLEPAAASECGDDREDSAGDPDFDAEPDGPSPLSIRRTRRARTERAGLSSSRPSASRMGDAARRRRRGAPEAPLVPSRAEAAFAPARSPVAAESAGLKRGRLIHRLLQRLPDLAPSASARGRGRLARAARATGWMAEARAALAGRGAGGARPSRIMRAFSAPESLAEVPISGMVDGRPIAAQVDRLVITGDSVTIVDYKTDRPAPTRRRMGCRGLSDADGGLSGRASPDLSAARGALRAALDARLRRSWILPDAVLDRHAP